VPVGPPPAAPQPPPQAQKAPVRERLHDADGEIAGTPGWRLKRVADPNVCGGTRIGVSRSKRRLDPDQQMLSKVYSIEVPTDLDFDPAKPKVKEASTMRFQAFLDELGKTGGDARTMWMQTVKDPATKAAAAARIAQASFRLASVLARLPVPKDVRTGEFAKDKVAAFCDMAAQYAEPILAAGEDALSTCATTSNAPAGWWTPMCARASAPAPSP